MSRKAAEYWWNCSAKLAGEPPVIIPPDVAYYRLYKSGRGKEAVTWKQVMRERRKKQELRLMYKREINDFEKPAFLSLELVNSNWLLIIKTIKKTYRFPMRYRYAELEQMCFHAFPLGVIGEFDSNLWYEEFYKTFKVTNPKKHQKTASAKVRVRIECGKIAKITKY
jgi:hypothetical protein